MPYFFNGRLWISPATMSQVNDSAMANQNLSVGNTVCYIGESAGGQPNTLLDFGSPDEAEATLQSGELLTAVMKAFSPSTDTGGPGKVTCVRVNPAVQSSLSLLDSTGKGSILLTSQDWGQWTNQIKVKLTAGSVNGLAATVQYGNSYVTKDNIAQNAFTVQYSGVAASATISITDTAVTLSAPTNTVVQTIDLTQFSTVQQLVDAINVVPGFGASVIAGSAQSAALNGLDAVTAQDVKTAAFTATANLQALVNWFNGTSQAYVSATRAAAAVAPPVAINHTYLTGGSDGLTNNTNWSNAFTALEVEDVQWITPISGDPDIAAMTDAHVQYMSTIGRMERRSICGTAAGTSDAQAEAAAQAINSDRTSLVHLGHYNYDLTGTLTGLQFYPPYLTAAILAAMFSAVSPGVALTNLSIGVAGLERYLQNPTDTDPLLLAGVLPVDREGGIYKVVQSVSTWLNNTNYNRREQSTGAAADFTVRNVRNALDPLRGKGVNPTTLGQAVSKTETQLKQLSKPIPIGPGVIVGDATNPPYKNITAQGQGDVIAVQFQCSPVIPANYIAVTVYVVPYSGSAAAA